MAQLGEYIWGAFCSWKVLSHLPSTDLGDITDEKSSGLLILVPVRFFLKIENHY